MRARMAVALLSIVGSFLALYLTLYKLGLMGTLSCSVGSCETVQTSRWAFFLGLPVAAWGLGLYVMLFGIALLGVQARYADNRAIPRALVALSAWGVLFSGWLTYLELFRIHAICIYCVTSAAILVAILVASVIDLRTPGMDDLAAESSDEQAIPPTVPNDDVPGVRQPPRAGARR